MYDRKSQNSVKQFSFTKNFKEKEKKEIMPLAATQMSPEIAHNNEISQRKINII